MNRRTTLILRLTTCTMALTALIGTSASAQSDAETSEKIVQLQRMAKAINLHDIMVSKFSEEIEKSAATNDHSLPEGAMELFTERVIASINTDDVITDVLVPVLDEYFTVKELTMIADFAEMPIAQTLVSSALNGKEVDMEAMMTSDELGEEEMLKLLQIYQTFNKKKDLLAKSDIGEKLNQAFEVYGQTLAMEVIGEMMELMGDEGMMEAAE